MANAEERPGAGAVKPTRDERMDRWFDRAVGRKGLRPRYAAYLVIMIWLVAIVVFGIFQRLADPDTFPTIWLAWWWAIQTVTTVGYGDVVPQQTSGKAVAALLMIGGLAFLSILTATITSSFIARREAQAQERGDDPVMKELARIGDRIEALEQRLPDPAPAPDPDPPSRPR